MAPRSRFSRAATPGLEIPPPDPRPAVAGALPFRRPCPSNPLSTESELARSFNSDVVERHARPFVELLERTMDWPTEPVRCLDLACGTGYATLPLLGKLAPESTIVAISDDRFALKELHKALDADLRVRVYPRKENPSRLPFAAGVFDLVWGIYPTQPVEPAETVLRRALRVLRPGGQLAIAVPLQGSFLELIQGIGLRDSDAIQRVIAEATQLDSLDGWQQLLRKCGGVDVRADTATFTLRAEPPLSQDRLLSRHLLPLWLGETANDATDQLLDSTFAEPLDVVVRLGCIHGRRGGEMIEDEPSVP